MIQFACRGPLSFSAASVARARYQKCTQRDRSRQSLAVGDRNETGILGTHFYDPYRNGSCTSSSTTSFAAGSGVLHPASTCPSAESKHYFCNRNDRLSLCFDGFTIDCFDSRLTLNAFSQGLQNR